ncbi:NUDIX domain-containing protein [Bdellovibrionota bacterium FG-1]
MKKLKVQVWIYRVVPSAPSSPPQFEILFLLLTPERGGFWQPVTGGVEFNEAVHDAALREANEETSLPFLGSPISLDYHFEFQARGQIFEEHVFAFQAVPASQSPLVRLDSHEHTDFCWVRADQAHEEGRRLIRHASNLEGLSRLLKRLEKWGENS